MEKINGKDLRLRLKEWSSLLVNDLRYDPQAKRSVFLGIVAGIATWFWTIILNLYTLDPAKTYTSFINSIDSGIEVITLQKLSNPATDYFFTYFYLFAGFIVIFTLSALIISRRWKDVGRLSLCSILILVPAFIAPLFFPVAPPKLVVRNVISIKDKILPSSESLIPLGFRYASFPSLHVVGATFSLLCIYSSKMGKSYVYSWIVILFLTSLSTIFLGEHYLVDVIAGFFVGVAIWMIAGKLQRMVNLR